MLRALYVECPSCRGTDPFCRYPKCHGNGLVPPIDFPPGEEPGWLLASAPAIHAMDLIARHPLTWFRHFGLDDPDTELEAEADVLARELERLAHEDRVAAAERARSRRPGRAG